MTIATARTAPAEILARFNLGNWPQENDETRKRVAKLAHALGLTVGDDENGFDGLTEEESVAVQGGKIALYSPGLGYAWEV